MFCGRIIVKQSKFLNLNIGQFYKSNLISQYWQNDKTLNCNILETGMRSIFKFSENAF